MKAIALLSGGLDSILAAKMILDLKIEVEALNFLTIFCARTTRGETRLASRKAANALGIPLKVLNVSEDYLPVLKRPKHGYGSNMNPCIDCRIFMMRKAKAYMEQVGASFIVTGEVLGERPMSQRRDAMRLIEREAGLDGLVLRPLSAKLLLTSLPEKEGWVDREKLLKIQGRSRKPQIQLAADYGIRDYPVPAGGCLLTDPGFSKRMKDLLDCFPDFSLNDLHLLKLGRHFRLSPGLKLVVGRNEEENQKIQTFSREGDILLRLFRFPGPLSLLRGGAGEEEIEKAAAITARYSKAKELKRVEAVCKKAREHGERSLSAAALSEKEVEALLIN